MATKLLGLGGQVTNAHSYGYNAARQRTAETNYFTNAWDYLYDDLGQLYSAKGREPNPATNRSHEQFGYRYDAAGNLSVRTNNLLQQTFTVNNLNQLSNATRSGTLTVSGATLGSPTSVKVNNSNSVLYLDAMFASTNHTPANGTNTFTAVATKGTSTNFNTITAWLPTNQVFQYDANGNLTSDGRRGYDYDDENQLIRITETNSWKSEFTYDGKLRLRVRKEYTWNGSSYAVATETRYVYDGMLVVQERDGNNTPTITYARGRDLSGAMEGAGGIGGLLAMTDHTETAATVATAYYHADGNGNVTALVNTNQIVVARYAYDPYGNTLSINGPRADVNRYRFSSKEAHLRSGFVYFGYRFYVPEVQRWMNRDPLGEQGGLNLYQAFINSPLYNYDPFGEFTYPILCPKLCPCTVNCIMSGSSVSGWGDYSTIRFIRVTATYTCTDCRGNTSEETKTSTRAINRPLGIIIGRRPSFPPSYDYIIYIVCDNSA